ncbi:MAG: hypothetical protein JWM34_5231 [Ilumatobacteraceae bacterium]|nr:hypothetical protein [Ilumatobacteraceae bacterium]
MRVKSPLVGIVAAVAAVLGCLMFTPGVSNAGIGASAAPSFPATVTVGHTGYSASLRITNQNFNDSSGPGANDETVTNTVCNFGDGAPCPVGDPGITLTPSCGALGPFSACGTSSADPGVFKVASTGTGSGACLNITFAITQIDATTGQLRFTPEAGKHVNLQGVGTSCVITFNFDVLKVPTIDFDPGTAGMQTVQIADNTQYNGTHTGSGRGTTSGVTVMTVLPTIATVASSTVAVGGSISDQVSVAGRYQPAASTVTFNLFGPNDATCSKPAIFTSTKALSLTEPGTATSDAFATTAPGVYLWTATYSGDVNNASVTDACNGTNENVTVTKQTPSINTTASGNVNVNSPISDSAVVSGLFNPVGGTVTFNLYGPDDATCAGAIVYTNTVNLSIPSGTATSASFFPTKAGVYRWIASYSGDANNAAVAAACNGINENVTVTIPAPHTPTIATTASPTVFINNPITDRAVVSGLVNPVAGATVTFNLYGPDDATCAAASIFTSTIAIATDGSANSAAYTPTLPGTYRWTAAYSGDINNTPVSEGCNGNAENVLVKQVSSSPPTTPAIATTVTGTLVAGNGLIDQATVTGRVDALAGSTVTFKVYGPNDATCTGPVVFTSTVGLDDSGHATSATFNTTAAGTYRWIATYSGDLNNNAVSGACGEPSETVTVTPAQPSLVTVATVNTALGGQVADTAQIAGRLNPVAGSTITFNLYGPDDATCAKAPIFTSTVPVNADGTATSATFAPTLVGTYRWIASYSGDANNSAVIAACNAPNEAVSLLGPDLQQSLPATGARTSVPLTLGTLLVLTGFGLLFGVRRRPAYVRIRR